MADLIRVGLLGLSQREGRFNELGIRSWEESGCAEVQRWLLPNDDAEDIFYLHRPLVLRGGQPLLQKLLREWCDAPHTPSRCDLILTVAGCGIGPNDVMPEATAAVLTRPLPGIADFVRHLSYQTPQPDAILSRGVSGLRRHTLLINLPGPSPELLGCVMKSLTPMLPAFVDAARTNASK